MAFQRVPDTAQFVVEQTYGTGESVIQNTFYVRNTLNSWDEGTSLASTNEDLETAWMAEMAVLQNVDMNSYRFLARSLDTEFGLYDERSNATGGSVTGEIAPLQLALGVKMVCDPGTAPRQGRLFISGLSVADIDFQAWLPATVTAVQDAIIAIHDALNGSILGNAVVRVSRYITVDGEKTLRDPALTNTLNSVTGEVRFWSQRDRRIGIGS